MKALITGASSGIGKDMAKILYDKGYELILVSKDKEKLTNAFPSDEKIKLISMDISLVENCIKLYETVKNENIDILINNAGFGLFGNFNETDLNKELNMIDTNIKAVNVLTKLFLKDFIKKDSGYILNVASSAAFLPGPLMATYYSTKAYVYRLTLSIKEELNRMNSKAIQENVEITFEIMYELNLLNKYEYELIRILGIFLDNAIEAERGEEEKKVEVLFVKDKESKYIIIENNCTKEVDIDKIYTKDFTTKEGNTGLGLWEVKNIVENNPNLFLETKVENNSFKHILKVV